jgi:hypothetical protein
MAVNKAFLAHRPCKIGAMDQDWNVLERCDQQSKPIHYTNLYTQPWKCSQSPDFIVIKEYHNARDGSAIGNYAARRQFPSPCRGYYPSSIWFYARHIQHLSACIGVINLNGRGINKRSRSSN